MTNEEKAVVMGLHVRDLCISKGVTRDNAKTASLLVQQSAMEMAEWKDQQFKDYLEKKKAEYAMPNGKYWYTCSDYIMRKWFTRCIDEIINELFGE